MIVEDGTGLPDAESYARLEDAASYHAAREEEAWMEASETEQAAALVRACDYLERSYNHLFKGRKLAEGQRLSFPRQELGQDGMRYRWLIEAQCMAALLELKNPGILTESPSMAGRIRSEREGLVSRSYTPGMASGRRFESIHALVAPYITSPSNIGLHRA